MEEVMKKNSLRKVLTGTALILVALMIALVPVSAMAEWNPKRPINLIVPYKAGGGTDSFARALSAAAKGIIDVPVVVVNKPGSSGMTGCTAAFNARPDGTTFLMTSSGSFTLTSMLRNTEITPLDSFKIVAQVGNLTTSLMVAQDSPFKTVKDLVEAAKASPGKLRWAHTGRGGFHHVAGQGFLNANGVKAVDVPYKGGSATRAAVMGGQVDFGMIGVQQAAGFEGKLRILALNAPERDKVMKDVPTFKEQGFAFVDVSSPIIVFSQKDVDDEVVKGLEKALEQIAASPKFAELMLKRGNAPAYQSGTAAEAKLRALKKDAQPIIDSLKK
jgi:tripartite-type tricarboxylate transporter receptor subunit TctC